MKSKIKIAYSLEELNNLITEAKNSIHINSDHKAWYRGHSNPHYKLIPSLMRIKNWKEKEKSLYKEYKKVSILIIKEKISDWDTLFDMQHYGVPTRLLDWTSCRNTALFFALENAAYNDIALFILNPHKLLDPENGATDKSNNNTIDDGLTEYIDFDDPIKADELNFQLLPCDPPHQNRRIVAQKGKFTIHGNFDQAIEDKYTTCVRKIIISKHALDEVREEIENTDLNILTIYPDIQGLAPYLKNKLSLIPNEQNASLVLQRLTDKKENEEYISYQCSQYSSDPFGRKLALNRLLEDALASKDYMKYAIEKRVSPKNTELGSKLELSVNGIHKDNYRNLIPPSYLKEKVNSYITERLKEMDEETRTPFFHTSGLGAIDAFNKSAQEKTDKINELFLGVNSPTLLVDYAFGVTPDPQREMQEEFKEYYFAAEQSGLTEEVKSEIDGLRKLIQLFGNLRNILNLAVNNKTSGTHKNIGANRRIVIGFFETSRPNYTYRFIKSTGDYFFFIHAFDAPHPYSTFGILGNCIEMCKLLETDYNKSLSRKYNLNNSFLESLEKSSFRYYAANLAHKHNMKECEDLLEQYRSKWSHKSGINFGQKNDYISLLKYLLSLEHRAPDNKSKNHSEDHVKKLRDNFFLDLAQHIVC